MYLTTQIWGIFVTAVLLLNSESTKTEVFGKDLVLLGNYRSIKHQLRAFT